MSYIRATEIPSAGELNVSSLFLHPEGDYLEILGKQGRRWAYHLDLRHEDKENEPGIVGELRVWLLGAAEGKPPKGFYMPEDVLKWLLDEQAEIKPINHNHPSISLPKHYLEYHGNSFKCFCGNPPMTSDGKHVDLNAWLRMIEEAYDDR